MRENILPVMPQFVKRESEKILPDPKYFFSTLFYLRFSDGLTLGAILQEWAKTKTRRRIRAGGLCSLAESWGFEPQIPLGGILA